MGKLTITTFLSLDGVMQAPGAPQEDPSGGFTQGGWTHPFFDAELGGFMVQGFERADAFLLGRGTYQIFAGHWPRVTDPTDGIAGPLNRLPKHVASRTLDAVDWAGSSLVRDVLAEVPRLKARYARELQVHGSPGLAQTLLAAGLVDELHVITFPVILGGGKRLFNPGAAPSSLQLFASRITPNGVAVLSYRRTGAVKQGSFALEG